MNGYRPLSLFASSMIDELTEVPTIRADETLCPECFLVHRGECF